jgi:hypothetical protein
LGFGGQLGKIIVFVKSNGAPPPDSTFFEFNSLKGEVLPAISAACMHNDTILQLAFCGT